MSDQLSDKFRRKGGWLSDQLVPGVVTTRLLQQSYVRLDRKGRREDLGGKGRREDRVAGEDEMED